MPVTRSAIFINFLVIQVLARWPPYPVPHWKSSAPTSAQDSDFGNPAGIGAANNLGHSSSDTTSSGVGAANNLWQSSSDTTSSGVGAANNLGQSSSDTTSSEAGGVYDGKVFQGEATTYASSWSIGNCLLHKWPQPHGLGPIAMATNLWDSARVCGACISITSAYGTHFGIITDQSRVKPNSLDMGPDVWSQVSNHQPSSAIPIRWNLVPCNFTAPIQFYNKDGVNPQYTAIQVAGANVPIKSLEARPSSKSGSGGNWSPLTRQSNSNHFTPSNGGLGNFADLRVTCESGKQIITENVNLLETKNPTPATGNC